MNNIVKIVFGYPLAALRFLLIILSMVVFMSAYFLTVPVFGNNQERAFRLRRHWLKYVALPVLNIKIEVKGTPPVEGNCLYICNHRSFADPVVILYFIDAFVIAKAEVANYPIINKGAELTGVLWVKRTDKSSRNATRQLMVETLKSGRNILVYPEGTVSTTQKTLPFNPGTCHSAAEEGFKIVPAAIEYRDTSDLWVYHHFVRQVFHQFSKWRVEVKLEFGDPLYGNDGELLKRQAETWINETMTAMQLNWSRAQYFGD